MQNQLILEPTERAHRIRVLAKLPIGVGRSGWRVPIFQENLFGEGNEFLQFIAYQNINPVYKRNYVLSLF